MKIQPILSALTALAVGIAVFGVTGCNKSDHEHSDSDGHTHQYTCPMHPEVVKDTAGDCPKCGMKLVEKK